MKKIKRILLIGFCLLAVLAVLAVILVGVFLDQIAKTGVETIGPKITQTPVTVEGISISPLTGSVGVTGLVLGNPSGYQTPSAISVGKTAVSVTPASLLADKIVIRSIELRAPEITFEGNPFGANNLQQIMNNVDGTAATNAPAASSSGGKPAKKLEVDEFLITGAKVHASITGMAGQEFTVDIPDIRISGLGQGADGITAADLTQKVFREISAGTLKAVGDYVKKMSGSAASDLLKGASANAEKASGQGVNNLKQGLNNLLGK